MIVEVAAVTKANSLSSIIFKVPVSSWKLEIELTRLDVFHKGVVKLARPLGDIITRPFVLRVSITMYPVSTLY